MITRGVLGTALLVALLLLLSGCATNRMSRAELEQAYDQFIITEKLEATETITAFRFDGWSELGQKHLIIDTGVNRSYLVKLRNTCFNLETTMAIKINNMGSQLRAKFDSISVPDELSGRCFIDSMYRITKEQKKALLALDNPKPEQEATEQAS
jgi:hypothetical protein